MTTKLKEGQKAPDFKMPSDGGGTVSLKDFRGKKLVLYFYPKDNTPGCTKESIGFSEAKAKFARAGAEIVGVSKDSVTKHDNFKKKHNLKIALGSDEGSGVCEAYGVWGEKKLYGKTHMGIIRSTFLIDGKGKIAKIWPKVKVEGHVEDVLEAVKALD